MQSECHTLVNENKVKLVTCTQNAALFTLIDFPAIFLRLYDTEDKVQLWSVYLSIYASMGLQPFIAPWPLFQFLHLLHSRYDSLDGGSARRKVATCTQNTNRIKAHRHSCLEWDSNPKLQRSSGRRRFMP
jgi:hypothetical protein